MRSWKLFTARHINQRTGRADKLWQKDYWDRLIRNEIHFLQCLEYIRENPEKAGLREGEFVLFEKVRRDDFQSPDGRGDFQSPDGKGDF